MKLQPILFIDLDGTIRQPITGKFVNDPHNQELMPGALDQLLNYKTIGYMIYIITNQGGVAHGYKTPRSFCIELEYLLQDLQLIKLITGVRASYHDPTGHVHPYNFFSVCRKPGIGHLAFIEEELFKRDIQIDWQNSLMVGDRPEDEQFAANAQLRFMPADEWRKPHPIQLTILSKN